MGDGDRMSDGTAGTGSTAGAAASGIAAGSSCGGAAAGGGGSRGAGTGGGNSAAHQEELLVKAKVWHRSCRQHMHQQNFEVLLLAPQ